MAEGPPKPNQEQYPEDSKKERVPFRNFIVPADEEWSKKTKEFFDTYILPPLTPEQEKESQLYFEGDESLWKRYFAVADKIEKTNAEVIMPGLGMASGYLLGATIFTTGKVLKYSLLGWTLDANGVPRKDAKSLADFDKTYKAAKEGGVLAGLAAGMAA